MKKKVSETLEGASDRAPRDPEQLFKIDHCVVFHFNAFFFQPVPACVTGG